MKTENKREYPRLHNGVVLYGPEDEPSAPIAEPEKQKAPKKKVARKAEVNHEDAD